MINTYLHKTVILVSTLFLASVQIASASDGWPATDSVGKQIAFYSDASGVVYQERLGTFFVVTNAGCVKQINISGTELSSYCPSAWTDLEGIAVADYDSNYLYLGLESPQAIYEFDISTNNLTGKSWTLSGMSVATGAGLEGLEYVNGYFYAASQNNGRVYKYSVDLSSSGSASLLGSFYPYSGYTKDLAALSYSADTDTLYSLYDGGNRLVTTKGDGTYINRYQLPTGTINEEGFVVVPNCSNSSTNVVITEDSGRIMLFSGFPIQSVQCPVVDADNDGVAAANDCNDTDASVSVNQTYYRDADGDGLGDPAVTSVVCSYIVTTGYVTNSTDLNDSDYDNDGVSTSSDCNDLDSSVSALLTVYQDFDGDGLGNPAVSQEVCATTAPTGYVTDNTDTDDSGIIPDPEPTYSPIEYLSNGVDDDGDGKIDEWNTLESNGVHPDADTINVTSFGGATNGAIKVRYDDGSGYRYTVFTVTTSKLTRVAWYETNKSLLVKLNRKYAIVDAFTGSIFASYSAVKK